MNAEQFALWLQGMLEYRDIKDIPEAELKVMLQGIKDHVALVFNKVTPEVKPKPVQKSPSEVQKALEEMFKKARAEPEKKPQPAKAWPFIPPKNPNWTPPFAPVPIPWPEYPEVKPNYDQPNYWLEDKGTGHPPGTPLRDRLMC
jgi:hypothetical protein